MLKLWSFEMCRKDMQIKTFTKICKIVKDQLEEKHLISKSSVTTNKYKKSWIKVNGCINYTIHDWEIIKELNKYYTSKAIIGNE